MSLGIIVSIGCFNATGVAITKYASAAQRSTVDTCRTLIIWIVSMLIGWEKFIALELVGFAMLVGGTIVYNEIYILPISIFNQNTKAAIAEREGKLDGFASTNNNYIATSPGGAGQMVNRNKRNIEAKEVNPQDDRQALMNRHSTHDNGEMYINDYSNKNSDSQATDK